MRKFETGRIIMDGCSYDELYFMQTQKKRMYLDLETFLSPLGDCNY